MRYFVLLCVALFCCQLSKAQTEENFKEVTGLYAFGYAATLNDSTVYITEIQEMPKVKMEKGTGFLVSRSSYTTQLKRFIEGMYGGHATCAIIFNENKDKLYKDYLRLIDKIMRHKQNIIKSVHSEDFTFIEVDDN